MEGRGRNRGTKVVIHDYDRQGTKYLEWQTCHTCFVKEAFVKMSRATTRTMITLFRPATPVANRQKERWGGWGGGEWDRMVEIGNNGLVGLSLSLSLRECRPIFFLLLLFLLLFWCQRGCEREQSSGWKRNPPSSTSKKMFVAPITYMEGES